MQFKNIALIGKYQSGELTKQVVELAQYLQSIGVNVYIDCGEYCSYAGFNDCNTGKLSEWLDILDLVIDICRTELEFDNFNDVAAFFKELINVGRQMNYSEYESDKFNDYYNQLQEMISSKNVNHTEEVIVE